MDNAVVAEPPPALSSDQNSVHTDFQFSAEMESLAIPPLDPQFFSSETFMSDLGFGSGDNCDFELTFDDFDDLYMPSDSDGIDFLIPDGFDPIEPAPTLDSTSPGSSAVVSIAGDQGDSDVSRFLNSPPSNESARHDHDQDCSENSVGPKSSISEAVNSPSNSGNSGNNSCSSKVTVGDETAKSCLVKRKKEESDRQGGNVDSKSAKYQRSDNKKHASLASVDDGYEEEDKRTARLIRNRESAQLSRQRKKLYVDELEDKVKSMHSTIADLNTRISYVMAENATLKHQLSSYRGGGGGGAMCPPPPGMYPMPPMPYPWAPYSPYVVNPQRSQVPLVPIPRLKPKKSESKKKAEGKTKKVASISFLGLLFFILLFGGLVPMMNVNFGVLMDRGPGGSSPGYFSDSRLYDEHGGRVLTVHHGGLNRSEESRGLGISGVKFDVSNGQMRREKECGHIERCPQPIQGSDDFFRVGNTSSEPLTASLYVPRNDRLVKIDGNLIIHSVLASEKAKDSRETSLGMGKDLVSALAIPEAGGNIGRYAPLYMNPSGPHKALTAGSPDVSKARMKSTVGDGKLQQWFREGLAGLMLSSGMCTEVFQFDVSAAIIPASSVSNVSEHRQNSTELNRGRNRRILRVLPSTDHNTTEENVTRRNQLNDKLPGNGSVSSMVVSVLVDPREAVDTEVDGMIKPKSLSRIFVVVLLDSVKYVTYSCMLPRSAPHLMTT